MNLSPEWAAVLELHEWDAIHWSTIGDPGASDRTIMEWARDNGYVVFTHDLDFGALLAATQAEGPSIIQVRTQDITPEALGDRMVQTLQQFESVLEAGALITVDEIRARVRILPIS